MGQVKLLRWLPWAGCALTLCAVTILAPFAMKWWAPAGMKWGELSDVSQTYSAVSIPLSGAALVGVVWSMVVQARQLRIANDNEMRASQRELVLLALDDPELLVCWDPPATPTTHARARQYAYYNLILSAWRVEYLNGTTPEATTLRSARVLMKGEIGREFWKTRRHGWEAYAATRGRRDRQFVRIMDEALKLAEQDGPATPPDRYFAPSVQP